MAKKQNDLKKVMELKKRCKIKKGIECLICEATMKADMVKSTVKSSYTEYQVIYKCSCGRTAKRRITKYPYEIVFGTIRYSKEHE